MNPSQVLKRVVSVADPVIYYARVSGSFFRQVAKHSNLTMPDIGKATQGISGFVNGMTTGQWRHVTLTQVGQFAKEGVKIGGFFLVGEMIGRGSVIGYQIEGASSGGHH